jgi:hypothetical protein
LHCIGFTKVFLEPPSAANDTISLGETSSDTAVSAARWKITDQLIQVVTKHDVGDINRGAPTLFGILRKFFPLLAVQNFLETGLYGSSHGLPNLAAVTLLLIMVICVSDELLVGFAECHANLWDAFARQLEFDPQAFDPADLPNDPIKESPDRRIKHEQ